MEDIILYNRKSDALGNLQPVVEELDVKAVSRENNRTVFDEILDKLLVTETSFKQEMKKVTDSHDNHIVEVKNELF